MPDAIDKAIEVLNEAVAACPEAVNELMNYETLPISKALAEHPTIQVGVSIKDPVEGEYVLRALGLINGLFGIAEDGYGFIGMKINETGIIKFMRLR